MKVMKAISNKTYLPFFFHIERGKCVLLLENESDVGTLSLGKALPSPEQKGD